MTTLPKQILALQNLEWSVRNHSETSHSSELLHIKYNILSLDGHTFTKYANNLLFHTNLPLKYSNHYLLSQTGSFLLKLLVIFHMQNSSDHLRAHLFYISNKILNYLVFFSFSFYFLCIRSYYGT